MKTKDVAKLTPLERFEYWCRERHAIYERRKAGQPKPWTDDEILRECYFTNVYRELDKTTEWFRVHVRDPKRDTPGVIFATVCFRWFNYIQTGEVLIRHGLFDQWDRGVAHDVLSEVIKEGGKVFTGAFMINSPPRESKLSAICRRVSNVWSDNIGLVMRAGEWSTMEQATADLQRYEGMGGFMAYEIVCDLRYTSVLEHATDKLTWSNPGPGAVRGLYRLLGREIKNKSNATSPPVPDDWQEQTNKLLNYMSERCKDMPPMEAREIEMSLCEYDKYSRMLAGDGRVKRKYDGVGNGPTLF